ncbi:hypothetical protein AC249_AIPGENE19471, partial [Exaiptasia diaphana]
MAEQTGSSFTGRSRSRKTRRSVVVIDRLAKGVITFGGIGTILSVLGVALFLVWVVLPLFLSADTSDLQAFDRGAKNLHGIGLDEYQTLGWSLDASGELSLFRLDNGEVLSVEPLFSSSSASVDSEAGDSESTDDGIADEDVPEDTPSASTPSEDGEAEDVATDSAAADPVPIEAAEIVSSSFAIRSETAAFGLSDGSIRMIDIGFKT